MWKSLLDDVRAERRKAASSGTTPDYSSIRVIPPYVGEQFRPSTPDTPRFEPVPEDYKWEKPSAFKDETAPILSTDATRFVNLIRHGLQGQYAQEPTQKDRIVKSDMKTDPSDYARYLGGRSSEHFEIEHTVPAWMGGTHTGANKSIYTKTQHAQKTRLDRVLNVLYHDRKIDLPEARQMTLNWRRFDVSEIPDNWKDITSNVADKAWARWRQQMKEPAKVTAKDYAERIIAGLPILSEAVPWATEKLGVDFGLRGDERREAQFEMGQEVNEMWDRWLPILNERKKLSDVSPVEAVGEGAKDIARHGLEWYKGLVSGFSFGHLPDFPTERERHGGAERYTHRFASGFGHAVGMISALHGVTTAGKAVIKPIPLVGSTAAKAGAFYEKVYKGVAGTPSVADKLSLGGKAIPWVRSSFSNYMRILPSFALMGQLSQQERDDVLARAQRFKDDALWTVPISAIGGFVGPQKMGDLGRRLSADATMGMATLALIKFQGGTWEEAVEGSAVMASLHHTFHAGQIPPELVESQKQARLMYRKYGIDLKQGKLSDRYMVSKQLEALEKIGKIEGRERLLPLEKQRERENIVLATQILRYGAMTPEMAREFSPMDYASVVQRVHRMTGLEATGRTREEVALAEATETMAEATETMAETMREVREIEDTRAFELSREERGELLGEQMLTATATGYGTLPLEARKAGMGEGSKVRLVRSELTEERRIAMAEGREDFGSVNIVAYYRDPVSGQMIPVGYMPRTERLASGYDPATGEKIEEYGIKSQLEAKRQKPVSDTLTAEKLDKYMRDRGLTMVEAEVAKEELPEGMEEHIGKISRESYVRLKFIEEGLTSTRLLELDQVYRQKLQDVDNVTAEQVRETMTQVYDQVSESTANLNERIVRTVPGDMSGMRLEAWSYPLAQLGKILSSNNPEYVRRELESRMGIRTDMGEVQRMLAGGEEWSVGTGVEFLGKMGGDKARVTDESTRKQLVSEYGPKSNFLKEMESRGVFDQVMKLRLITPKAFTVGKPPTIKTGEVKMKPEEAKTPPAEMLKKVQEKVPEKVKETPKRIVEAAKATVERFKKKEPAEDFLEPAPVREAPAEVVPKEKPAAAEDFLEPPPVKPVRKGEKPGEVTTVEFKNREEIEKFAKKFEEEVLPGHKEATGKFAKTLKDVEAKSGLKRFDDRTLGKLIAKAADIVEPGKLGLDSFRMIEMVDRMRRGMLTPEEAASLVDRPSMTAKDFKDALNKYNRIKEAQAFEHEELAQELVRDIDNAIGRVNPMEDSRAMIRALAKLANNKLNSVDLATKGVEPANVTGLRAKVKADLVDSILERVDKAIDIKNEADFEGVNLNIAKENRRDTVERALKVPKEDRFRLSARQLVEIDGAWAEVQYAETITSDRQGAAMDTKEGRKYKVAFNRALDVGEMLYPGKGIGKPVTTEHARELAENLRADAKSIQEMIEGSEGSSYVERKTAEAEAMLEDAAKIEKAVDRLSRRKVNVSEVLEDVLLDSKTAWSSSKYDFDGPAREKKGTSAYDVIVSTAVLKGLEKGWQHTLKTAPKGSPAYAMADISLKMVDKIFSNPKKKWHWTNNMTFGSIVMSASGEPAAGQEGSLGHRYHEWMVSPKFAQGGSPSDVRRVAELYGRMYSVTKEGRGEMTIEQVKKKVRDEAEKLLEEERESSWLEAQERSRQKDLGGQQKKYEPDVLKRSAKDVESSLFEDTFRMDRIEDISEQDKARAKMLGREAGGAELTGRDVAHDTAASYLQMMKFYNGYLRSQGRGSEAKHIPPKELAEMLKKYGTEGESTADIVQKMAEERASMQQTETGEKVRLKLAKKEEAEQKARQEELTREQKMAILRSNLAAVDSMLAEAPTRGTKSRVMEGIDEALGKTTGGDAPSKIELHRMRNSYERQLKELEAQPATEKKETPEKYEPPKRGPGSKVGGLLDVVRSLQGKGEKKVPTVHQNEGWARKSDNGYEVSTAGDSRFSALNARLPNGKTIEVAYQTDVKGYDSFREGKGKSPKNDMTREETYEAYKNLWRKWADNNPKLLKELVKESEGKVLTDKYANTNNNQARALHEIMVEKGLRGKGEKKALTAKGSSSDFLDLTSKVKEAIKSDVYGLMGKHAGTAGPRVIVAGSRSVTDYATVKKAIEGSGIKPNLIISGTAKGVDTLGERYAKEKGIEVLRMPADWDTHGKSAGYRRNAEMATVGDTLIAIWDGKSKGTKHMIDLAESKGLKVIVVEPDKPTGKQTKVDDFLDLTSKVKTTVKKADKSDTYLGLTKEEAKEFLRLDEKGVNFGEDSKRQDALWDKIVDSLPKDRKGQLKDRDSTDLSPEELKKLEEFSKTGDAEPVRATRSKLPGPGAAAVDFFDLVSTVKEATKGKKLYHGTRTTDLESFVDKGGNLVLKASENFGGKQVAVSFSEDINVAKGYGSRSPGKGPIRSRAQGQVFEIERDAIKNKLYEESGEEIATRGIEDVVVPKGKWKIVEDVGRKAAQKELKEWEEDQRQEARDMSDSELTRDLVQTEDYDVVLENYPARAEMTYAHAAEGVTQDILAKYGTNSGIHFLRVEFGRRMADKSMTEKRVLDMAKVAFDVSRLHPTEEFFPEKYHPAIGALTKRLLDRQKDESYTSPEELKKLEAKKKLEEYIKENPLPF